MLENLSTKLSGVVKTLSGNARLTESNIEDALREVRIALLEADVAIPVVKTFIEKVRLEAIGQKVIGSLKPDQAFRCIIYKRGNKWPIPFIIFIMPPPPNFFIISLICSYCLSN